MVKLEHCLTILVPWTVNKNELHDSQPEVDWIVLEMTHMFGGATVSPPSEGAWMDDNDQMIIEKVSKVESFCTTEQKRDYISEFYSLALRLKLKLKQDSIAVIVDQCMYYI